MLTAQHTASMRWSCASRLEPTERLEIRLYSRLAYQDGCDGVEVSTVGCGPAGPGSIPGHGPILDCFNYTIWCSAIWHDAEFCS